MGVSFTRLNKEKSSLPAFMEVKGEPKTEMEVLMSKIQIMNVTELKGILEMPSSSIRAIIDKFQMEKKTLLAKLEELSANWKEPDYRKEQTIFGSIQRINDYLSDIETIINSPLRNKLI